MDSTAFRQAYEELLQAAARPDLGDADDGGWNADQILAHVLSVDAAVAAVALGIVSGARPTFDNRASLDPWNLARIVDEHSGRAELIGRVRRQASTLADLAEELSPAAIEVLVPSLMLSNGTLVLDQPVPLGGLIDGLTGDHVPVHTRQLLDLGAVKG